MDGNETRSPGIQKDPGAFRVTPPPAAPCFGEESNNAYMREWRANRRTQDRSAS